MSLLTGNGLFTSRRESVTWLIGSIVVTIIFSTLGMAPAFSGELVQRGLFDGLFVVGFLLLVAAVVTNGLRTRPSRMEIFVGLGLAGIAMMFLARMAIPEERTHLIEYGLVALLIHEALTERRRNGSGVRRPALFAFLVTAALGWIDEGIQAILPNRLYDLRDIAFNWLAAFAALSATALLGWIRRRIADRSD